MNSKQENTKRPTKEYIITKMLKVKNKEKFLKSATENFILRRTSDTRLSQKPVTQNKLKNQGIHLE